jgi:hypothetical protein
MLQPQLALVYFRKKQIKEAKRDVRAANSIHKVGLDLFWANHLTYLNPSRGERGARCSLHEPGSSTLGGRTVRSRLPVGSRLYSDGLIVSRGADASIRYGDGSRVLSHPNLEGKSERGSNEC